MEAISLIIAALVVGAIAGVKDTAGLAATLGLAVARIRRQRILRGGW
jgi:hypothetical protein